MKEFNIQKEKRHYLSKKYDDLDRFISYFYQIKLLRDLRDKLSEFRVLEIGKGNGFVSFYLKQIGFEIMTCDIDESLKPDYVADVRNLPFEDNNFDAVMAYEVLEHLPFEELEKALGELRRVSRKYAFISLPYRSAGFEAIIKFPYIRTIFRNPFFDLFFRIPLKFKGFHTSGQHYWEIDSKRYSLRRIRQELAKNFKILKELRPPINSYHYFFVLEKF